MKHPNSNLTRLSIEKQNDLANFAKRLTQLLNVRFKSNKAEFARAVGVAASTANPWFSGTGGPQLEQIMRIVEVGEVNPEWLLLGRGRMFYAQGAGPEPDQGQPTSELWRNLFDAQTKHIERLERMLADLQRENLRLRHLAFPDEVKEAQFVSERSEESKVKEER
jgi:transcriptional regulator with XRE-family HTH domain